MKLIAAGTKKVLILGHHQDAHSVHLKEALQQAGATVKFLETHLFPTQLRLSWHPDTQYGSIVFQNEGEWALHEIHSFFWRQIIGVHIPSLHDEQQQRFAYSDSMSLLRSLIQACPERWFNSWEAYQFHKEKPLQLSSVKLMGINIPRTLVSNDPKQIAAFVRSQEKVIFKPVYGGAYTQFVKDTHLEPERLKLALSLSPVTLQEYITGTNIRSYVIGKSIFSAEIRTQSLDFREDKSAEVIPVELPDEVQKQCLAITENLKLNWTAIDWRLKPSNEYVFLEANPSPMFLHFEQKSGYPTTRELVRLLMN